MKKIQLLLLSLMMLILATATAFADEARIYDGADITVDTGGASSVTTD